MKATRSSSGSKAAGAAPRAGAAAPPASEFPVASLRARFPALREASPGTIFFDNAAGAQVPDEVLAGIQAHLVGRNVQIGGRYALSREVDAEIAETRRLLSAFLNAATPEEIVFGLNSTSLTRTVAESLRPRLRPGDRVIVTDLDHEANIGPWMRLETTGVDPLVWKVRRKDAALHLEDLSPLLEAGRVRLLALPLASNATGRIVDVSAAARMAHGAGAKVFVDAVHYGPHGPIDAATLGADFLVFSGYKIFGPHVGFLWGRPEALQALEPAREFFVSDRAPQAFEGGTQCYEAIAGMAGAMRYLASIGGEEGDDRARLRRGMDRIRAYEVGLIEALLSELSRVPGLRILGDSDPASAGIRVPTVSFRIEGRSPQQIVEGLAARSIQARDGHMYSPRLILASGVEVETGVARVSLCHYNTHAEIARLGEALRSI